MINLGFIKEDLNTLKTREDFPAEDLRITELHFQNDRKRLLESINSLLIERKRLKNRNLIRKIVSGKVIETYQN